MSSNGRLAGKVALVTGGANEKGFGAAIARAYVKEGARVLICDIVEESGHKIVESLGGSHAKFHRLDVTKEADWKSAVDTCVKEYGRIDILVNNAGTTYTNKSTLKVEEHEFDRVYAVNVKSIFWSVKAVVPQMQKQGGGGSIINISSVGSVRPRPGLVWYNSSKAAVTNASKAMAAEFGGDNIRVNAIAPLLSGTALFSAFVGVEDTPENRKKFTEPIPLKRLAEPSDIANAALFLASDEGKFVTGVNLEVDGGRCI